jgi:hypothetical protein
LEGITDRQNACNELAQDFSEVVTDYKNKLTKCLILPMVINLPFSLNGFTGKL